MLRTGEWTDWGGVVVRGGMEMERRAAEAKIATRRREKGYMKNILRLQFTFLIVASKCEVETQAIGGPKHVYECLISKATFWRNISL